MGPPQRAGELRIALGYFETELTAPMFESEDQGRADHLQHPLRRAGVEGELDGVLFYPAPDAPTYCTAR